MVLAYYVLCLEQLIYPKKDDNLDIYGVFWKETDQQPKFYNSNRWNWTTVLSVKNNN